MVVSQFQIDLKHIEVNAYVPSLNIKFLLSRFDTEVNLNLNFKEKNFNIVVTLREIY